MEFDLDLDLVASRTTEHSQYFRRKTEFARHNVTWLRQTLLRRIAQDAPFRAPGIEAKINQIADFLLLNPIELAYWESLLHGTSLAEREMPVASIYLFTGYLSKISLNENTELFEEELSKHIKGFSLLFAN